MFRARDGPCRVAREAPRLIRLERLLQSHGVASTIDAHYVKRRRHGRTHAAQDKAPHDVGHVVDAKCNA